MKFPVLWSGLVSRVGASHRVNPMHLSPLDRNAQEKLLCLCLLGIHANWIYENRAKDKSPSLTLYKKLHRPLNSIIHRQSGNTQPTHPPFLCVAGWCLDSHLAGQCLARALLQRKSAFSLTKMPVSVTHSTPLEF